MIQILTVHTLTNKVQGSRVFKEKKKKKLLLLTFDMLWKVFPHAILFPKTEMPITENQLVRVTFCI